MFKQGDMVVINQNDPYKSNGKAIHQLLGKLHREAEYKPFIVTKSEDKHKMVGIRTAAGEEILVWKHRLAPAPEGTKADKPGMLMESFDIKIRNPKHAEHLEYNMKKMKAEHKDGTFVWSLNSEVGKLYLNAGFGLTRSRSQIKSYVTRMVGLLDRMHDVQ